MTKWRASRRWCGRTTGSISCRLCRAAEMRIDTRLAHEAFAPAQELAAFTAEGAGAIASFTGLARPTTKDGAPIDRLFLDHHSRLTRRSLDEIAASAERFGVSAVCIVHRCGE